MTILITSIAGFIGSHLGKKLISMDYILFEIDNFYPFYPIKFKSIHFL